MSGIGEQPTDPPVNGLVAPRCLVMDTSVVLKWYIPEAGSVQAQRFQDVQWSRHAPDFLCLEAAHALLKRSRSQDPAVFVPHQQAEEIIRSVRDDKLIQYSPSEPLLEPAFAMAREIGSSFYDGLFLALAIELDARLVTADRPFHTKIVASRHQARACWFEDPI